MSEKQTPNLKWARIMLFMAACYNLFWGAVISIKPEIILFGNPSSAFMLILIRCIGMLVGVYGIAYYFCSKDPVRYWPLILVGFIGKVLGPIGSIYYIAKGLLQPAFIWLNVWNDFIWLIPFALVLYQAIRIEYNLQKS